jgi:hypothetical protein
LIEGSAGNGKERKANGQKTGHEVSKLAKEDAEKQNPVNTSQEEVTLPGFWASPRRGAMKREWLLPSLIVVVLAVGTVAFFLSTRSKPQYCWLVFGPQAQLRVLVRLDGKTVSLDRDGDGTFDGKGERFDRLDECKDVLIKDSDGKTSYVITLVDLLPTVPPEKFVEVRVKIKGPLEFPQGCIIGMTNEPKGAPEAHFHGPLTIGPASWKLEAINGTKNLVLRSLLPASLQKTEKTKDLFAGVGMNAENSFVCLNSRDDKNRTQSPFPEGVHPFVDVEFPPQRTGDPPIKKRYSLNKFC